MKKRRLRRFLWLMLGAVALSVLAWLMSVRPYIGYVPVRSDAWQWMAFHVHSTMSDGHGTPEEIARAARVSGIGMVILADHGRPNPAAAAFRETFDGVTIIGGSEANLPEGHLIGFGMTAVPPYWLPPWPPDALSDLTEWGGAGAVAYPEDAVFRWQYWEPGFRPAMLEVLNPSTVFRRLGGWEKTRLVAAFGLSEYAFLDFLAPPVAELARWDQLLADGPVFALFGLNAHGGVHLGGGLRLPVPSYAALFNLWAVGLTESEADPEEALRRGEYFCCLRGAAEPARLCFDAVHGKRVYPVGNWTVPAEASLRLDVAVDGYTPRLVLRRDGRQIREIVDRELVVDRPTPGVYRAEIYLTDHPLLAPDVPWILTNPLRVTPGSAGESPPAPVRTPSAGAGESDHPKSRPKQTAQASPPTDGPVESTGPTNPPADLDGTLFPNGISPDLRLVDPSVFHIEKDAETTATYAAVSGVWTLDYHLAEHQTGGDNRWVALADRSRRDLSEYSGFHIRAWSDTQRRYYVEIRSGDRWYYASFKCYPGRETVCHVPFSRFYRVLNGRQPIPLADIDSWFITQSNYTGPAGFSARLKLLEIGFYR
ncbi:MAG: CIA30 family protein [Acidobacteria bacterium]|nr:CIA30 family protein [Acidobacteriota bacterium]